MLQEMYVRAVEDATVADPDERLTEDDECHVAEK